MICDGESNPMCIGGVFGGIESGVTENTTAIFLEAAYFNPVSIRKTAKRHGLNTDASFRFERGIDPNITEYALKRAAVLIEEIAGGQISSDIVDIYPNKIEDHQVHLSYDRAFKLIGEEISKEAIKNILASLEIKINNETETGLGLTIPAYRVDVTREADIVEEILRVYGYNNIKTSQKLSTSISYTDNINAGKLQNLVSDQLVALGFNEMMANSLTKPEYIELSELLKQEHNVEMLNPLSVDLSVMRQSLLFSGLEALSYNLNRKNASLKLFEFGTTYHKYESGYNEVKHLTLTITGNRAKDSWTNVSETSDFFYLKGVINSLIERLGIRGVKSSPAKSDIYSEGLLLKQGKVILGEFGVVKRSILREFSIKQEVLFADLNWQNILQLMGKKSLKVKELPKFPIVKRDLALLLDDSISFKELHATALQTEKQLLKDVDLFDVYQGKNLPKGKKSYAVSFQLLDENKTLNDKQIDKVMQKLQNAFERNFNAELR